MPKYTKRIQSYQIQGSHLNEFEFQQDQGALAHTPESPFPNEGQQTNIDPAARIAEVTAAAHRKVEKRKRLGLAPSGGDKKGAARKGPTKRVAKKVAKKVVRKAAKKAVTKAAKKPAKRTAAKKRASTSGGSKRSAKKATKTAAKKKPSRPTGKNRK